MANCKGCGKEIVWGILPSSRETGPEKKIPLDPKPPCYFYSMFDESIQRAPVGTYVSHFATCPKANDFSASKPKPQPELDL